MEITIDSREKKCDHIKQWLGSQGIGYIVKKLDVGDYQLADNPAVSVDRKQNLQELSKNLMNRKDHSRFWKEVRRANETGVKLYIVCEHGDGIESIEDVVDWHDEYSGVSGRKLLDEMYRVKVAYNVEFMFCKKQDTASKIVRILTQKDDAETDITERDFMDFDKMLFTFDGYYNMIKTVMRHESEIKYLKRLVDGGETE